MQQLFAGPVFTQSDGPAILLAIGVAILLTLVPIALIIWGIVGLRKKNEKDHSKRITGLAIGVLLLVFIQSRFNLFGWMFR